MTKWTKSLAEGSKAGWRTDIKGIYRYDDVPFVGFDVPDAGFHTCTNNTVHTYPSVRCPMWTLLFLVSHALDRCPFSTMVASKLFVSDACLIYCDAFYCLSVYFTDSSILTPGVPGYVI